jgi:hypothetical protein
VNFVEDASFILYPIKGYIADLFFCGILLCMCMVRSRGKGILHPPARLLGFENSGSLLSIKQLDRLTKDTIVPRSYRFLCKDLLAKRHICQGAIAAEQRSCSNSDLRKNSLSKQFSMAQALCLDGPKVCAWGKRFEQTTNYSHRELQQQIQTVVEKDTIKNG